MGEETTVIVFLCLLLVAVLAIIPITILIEDRWKKQKKMVRENSTRIAILNQLNKQFPFHSLSQYYVVNKKCHSKSNYDKVNFDSVFYEYVKNHSQECQFVFEMADENAGRYSHYKREVKSIPSTSRKIVENCGVSERNFLRIEKEIFDGKVQKPIITVCYKVTKSYVSPRGRNSYYESRLYNKEMFFKTLEKVNKNIVATDNKQKERSKMSDSLRYDIMKRDGFRCCICGISVDKDPEIVLHVDHIFPVSKGGKTEPSNLRTLCSRCNLGKRDKYDNDGKN